MSTWAIPFPARVAKLFVTEERRVTQRHDCYLESYCQPNDGTGRDTWWLGEVRDLSVYGIGLLSSRRFEPGTFLDIELQDPNRAPARPPTAWVVHSKPHSGGGWVMGCSFERRLSDGEVRKLVS